jgi:hypothetical protein
VRGGYGRADAEFLVVGGDEHRDLIRTDLAAVRETGRRRVRFRPLQRLRLGNQKVGPLE